jgi:ABC-type ATPase with predicted acetyltransferase domain
MGLFNWANLGKNRSGFGIWIDKKGIKQIDIEKASGLSRFVVSQMCNDSKYTPKISTFVRLQKGIKKLGYQIEYGNFW